MKFSKYLLAVLVGVSLTTGFTGCQSEDESLTEHSYTFNDQTFYTSESDMEMGLNACYRQIQ